jgi:putrescine---pyruvate transaminase
MGSLWHPFAPMAHVAEHPFVVVRGEGAYVFDAAGRRYLDGTASLWYANIGYGRREVADAVARQMETLHAYHLFVDFATPPALELADRIASLAPIEGSKVFLTSGGSDAVDTAAKLARRYFHEIGQPERTVLIAREWAYHGMHGFGTSLGGMEPNRIGYGPLIEDVVLVPHDDPEAVEKAIDHVGTERVAGMICEPVIGAGGVRPAPEGYLPSVREAVRRAGALFVADEVITGFGRCGDWFASTRFDLEPDIITFAKGVTAGYLPLGGVIAAPHIAAPFFERPGVIWRHGYTYSGHTSACVAALVVLDIIEREGILERAQELEGELMTALAPLSDLEGVDHIRGGVGALGAVQLTADDPLRAGTTASACREAGVITRAMGGGALQVSPPLILTTEQVDELADGLRRGIEASPAP